MEEQWMTTTEAALELGVGESTIRSWRDRYPQYVPVRVVSNRKAMPLSRLQMVKDLVKGRSTEEVRAALADRFPVGDGDESAFGAESQQLAPASAAAIPHPVRSVMRDVEAEMMFALLRAQGERLAERAAEDRQGERQLEVMERLVAEVAGLREAITNPPRPLVLEPPKWSLRWWWWRIVG